MNDSNADRSLAVRPAALFDYDGTLIRGDSTLLLLLFTLKRYPRAVGTLAALAAALLPFLAGRISRERIKTLALGSLRHVPPPLRQSFFRDFHQRCLEPRLLPEGLRRLAWHRKQGHLLVLVSASVDLYLEEVSAHLGVHHLVCSRAILDPSPHLVGPNCRGEEKIRRLMLEPFARTIRWEESWAYGDSLADRPLLELCGNPVAVRPHLALARHARRLDWPILHW